MRKFSSFLFFASILLVQHACSQALQTVDADRFEEGMATEVQLLDVRTPEEFKQGHLKNAMLADWKDKEEFVRRTEALDKDKPVYVYCLSGGRSRAAAEALKEMGFSRITELAGGINAWKQSEKPLEGEVKIAQISPEAYRSMVEATPLVLVDFGAPWCPPCRKMEPIIQEVKKEYAGKITLLPIDGGSQTNLMKIHAIQEMPTYVLYRNGKEVWRKEGMQSKEALDAALSQAID